MTTGSHWSEEIGTFGRLYGCPVLEQAVGSFMKDAALEAGKCRQAHLYRQERNATQRIDERIMDPIVWFSVVGQVLVLLQCQKLGGGHVGYYMSTQPRLSRCSILLGT
jgi:hypothetical protein